ncbi:universal stress protein [Allohahella marinimesophila]|uniref:Universal stress protein n=1 Tax=Allohahella marinimesophila TaxID=1054972 RepID=A0ABP7P4D1_9GAMM
MTYRTLFAPHQLESGVQALQPIIHAAADLGAHLKVVVVGTLMRFTPSAGWTSLDGYWGEHYSDTVKRCEERVEAVRAELGAAGAPGDVSYECLELGELDSVLIRHALLADASVFSAASIQAHETIASAFNGLLLSAGQPVLVLGEEARSLKSIKRVIVAWTQKRESARALRDALPLLSAAEDVRLVSVDLFDEDGAPKAGEGIALYLSRHGINAETDNLETDGLSVSETLKAYADTIDADLIVMGAYGHSRLREWLLGGTTREMLKGCRKPILMSH